MQQHKLSTSEAILLIAGFITIILIVFIFNRPAFNDEASYLENVPLIHKYGLSNKYLINLYGSAGPLYSLFHYTFEPITHLQAPQIRFLNICSLLGIIYLIFCTLRLFKHISGQYALYTMALPITYAVSGLALTEIPAMLFFSLGLFFVAKSVTVYENILNKALFYVIIGAACIGLSVLGRQPYIIILAGLPFLFLTRKNILSTFLLLLTAIVFTATIPLYVFFVWKGLMPPSDASFYTDVTGLGSSYRIDFFILCLFYFAATMLLIAPSFYIFPKKNKIPRLSASYVLISLLNLKTNLLSYTPLVYVARKMNLSNSNANLLSNLCGSGIILFGLYFLINSLMHLKERYEQKEFSFFMIALLLMAFSCSKITWGFSSRYAAQAIPLLVITGSYFYTSSKWNIARIIVGIAIGVVSLVSYFIG
jgi:hypothetical protein